MTQGQDNINMKKKFVRADLLQVGHHAQFNQFFNGEQAKVLPRGGKRLVACDLGTHAYRDANAFVVVYPTNAKGVNSKTSGLRFG